MAEIITRALLVEAGLDDKVVVDSAGTGDWHTGEPADRRTITALRSLGYDGAAHRAQWFETDWVSHRDLILVADSGHLRAIRRLAEPGPTDHIRLIRSFDPDAGEDMDLDDPWYGGAAEFERCADEVERACQGLVDYLDEQLRRR